VARQWVDDEPARSGRGRRGRAARPGASNAHLAGGRPHARFQRGTHAGRAGGWPVVVLLDIKLPKVDGLEVLQQVRADAQLSRTPVVMLTSSREEKDIVKSYNLGVNAYVVKPVDFHEFMTAICELGLFWAVINQPPPATQ